MNHKQITAAQIIVMQEWLQGKRAQACMKGSGRWYDLKEDEPPLWDWLNQEYRIKPEPKLVPLGPEDVPPGSAIRQEGFKYCWRKCLGVFVDGVSYHSHWGVGDCIRKADWGELERCWQIKRPGEDWQPCRKLA